MRDLRPSKIRAGAAATPFARCHRHSSGSHRSSRRLSAPKARARHLAQHEAQHEAPRRSPLRAPLRAPPRLAHSRPPAAAPNGTRPPCRNDFLPRANPAADLAGFSFGLVARAHLWGAELWRATDAAARGAPTVWPARAPGGTVNARGFIGRWRRARPLRPSADGGLIGARSAPGRREPALRDGKSRRIDREDVDPPSSFRQFTAAMMRMKWNSW